MYCIFLDPFGKPFACALHKTSSPTTSVGSLFTLATALRTPISAAEAASRVEGAVNYEQRERQVQTRACLRERVS